jgi:hypothetical protein
MGEDSASRFYRGRGLEAARREELGGREGGREKVFVEVNRPTFLRLSPPLSEVCQFISFSTLRNRLKEVEAIVRYLKPEFLDELSEVCQIEDA